MTQTTTPNERAAGFGVLRLVLFMLVFTVLGLGLLYAYRAYTPSVPTVALTQVLAEIHDGRVQAITIDGDQATVMLNDGRTERTTGSSPDDLLVRAVVDHNQADPTHPILLRVQRTFYPDSGFGVVVLSLLPLLLLVALIVLAAAVLVRARSPQRFDMLARLGDLRDRGVITEEEFQREKRRLLR
ncbi:MAG: SHOCT domain-containing protein [Chloroflexi bacterium]|nr:MAG: SHOCT domain-containing protein [Chloroflexota bacterium]